MMKRLIFLLLFFISLFAHSQIELDKIDWRDKTTTAIRDSWTIENNKSILIWNLDDQELQLGMDDQMWYTVLIDGITYPSLDIDGSGTIIQAGTNVTLSGTGTTGDPYIINSSGGGGGSNTVNVALETDGSNLRVRDSEGNSVSIAYSEIASNVQGSLNVNDADADPNNEIELPDDSGATAGWVLHTDGGGNYTWEPDDTETGGGGADGVITNVSWNGTDLVYTGTGGGFNNSVTLSNLAKLDAINTFQGNNSFLGAVDAGDDGIYFGVDDGVSGQRFRTAVVSSDLAIQYQNSANTDRSGAYSTIYTFNSTGTPANSTDLIDIEYANSNYVTLNTDQTIAGIKSFNNTLGLMALGGTNFGSALGLSDNRWKIAKNSISDDFEFSRQVSAATTIDLGTYTVEYTLNSTGVPVNDTDLIDKAYFDANSGGGSTDDQTLSEVLAQDNILDNNIVIGTDNTYDIGTWTSLLGGVYSHDFRGQLIELRESVPTTGNANRRMSIFTGSTGTLFSPSVSTLNETNLDYYYSHDTDTWGWESAATIRIEGLAGNGSGVVGVDNDGDLFWQADGGGGGSGIQSPIGGRTGQTINSAMIQTQTQFDTDGATAVDELVIIDDPAPATVVTGTIIDFTDQFIVMIDDTQTDSSSFDFQNCKEGKVAIIYTNQSSEPSFTGTGLTFRQAPDTLDWTTDALADTAVKAVFEVTSDPTVIDWTWVKR